MNGTDWAVVDIWYPNAEYPDEPDHVPALAILNDDGSLTVEPLPIVEVEP